ncbi:hypothetical protein [Sphingobacterium sp. 1.A.4]|uniref:hypothetical protein n=1 Tax=Sphingobacterium sp. 1.A.4 TaxID=2044603 RepID=UPI000C0BFEB0|nr:hypothetical protein [Sphingobacterium sp. 1.A.4]
MKTITINKGQKLMDLPKSIFPHIPSNHIIFKNITGIGATTMEILDLTRHSIIIEPNVPVIIGKEKKHPEILGVYRGVSERHVLEYLLNENIKKKKILTTPESFQKIVLACIDNQSRFNLYKDFFLLFDECDKITKDIEFRESITDPLTHFFMFDNKAFISATALVPTDPRFKSQNFEYLSIIPNYDITMNIDLHITNNQYALFQLLIKQNEGRKNFIFFNSIRGIEKIISKLNISNESAVFVSDKSLGDIEGKVQYASSSIEEECFVKYNFFTSRFFSAVDIDIDYDCNIFLITDTHMAEHSIIDANSEAIQIIGRFRNDSFRKKIIAISNVDDKLNCKKIEDAEIFIHTLDCVYSHLLALHDASTKPSQREAFKISFEGHVYNKFLDPITRKKSYFLIDNYFLKQKCLFQYTSQVELIDSYNTSSIFNTDINYFNVETYFRNFFYDSQSDISRRIFRSYKQNITRIFDLLDGYNHFEPTSDEYNDLQQQVAETQMYFPEIFLAIKLNLLEEIYKAHCKTDVEKAIKSKLIDDSDDCMPFIEDLRNEFPINSEWQGDDLKQQFGDIIDKYSLPMKHTIVNAKRYLEISDRYKGRGENRNIWFYKILDHK